MYTLQIRSASHEIAVRDRHLALLSNSVEGARAEAARRHEEGVAFGALLRAAVSHKPLASHCALTPSVSLHPAHDWCRCNWLYRSEPAESYGRSCVSLASDQPKNTVSGARLF